jgi:hypothetical protein
MKQLVTLLLSFALLSTQAQYSGMTPVKFSSTLQGLIRLPASYRQLSSKKYPVIFHFCGNNQTADKGGLALLMNSRQRWISSPYERRLRQAGCIESHTGNNRR